LGPRRFFKTIWCSSVKSSGKSPVLPQIDSPAAGIPKPGPPGPSTPGFARNFALSLAETPGAAPGRKINRHQRLCKSTPSTTSRGKLRVLKRRWEVTGGPVGFPCPCRTNKTCFRFPTPLVRTKYKEPHEFWQTPQAPRASLPPEPQWQARGVGKRLFLFFKTSGLSGMEKMGAHANPAWPGHPEKTTAPLVPRGPEKRFTLPWDEETHAFAPPTEACRDHKFSVYSI